MKCKYCNADIEQDAQFCTNCGKDLSKFKKCISCGELLDRDTEFCPFCGTKQSAIEDCKHETVADSAQPYEKKNSKKWIWITIIIVLLAILGGGGYWYISQKPSQLAEAVDTEQIASTDSIEVQTDIQSVDGITERLYEIFINGFELDAKEAVNKYFSEEFRALYKKVDEIDRNSGEIGFWEGNIWDGGQDDNPTDVEILNVEKNSPTTASFVANIQYHIGDYHSANKFSMSAVFENGNWFIDENNDMRYKESMKQYIKDNGSSENISLVNKVYKGSGNGGGLSIDMTITFLEGGKCTCVSDWYQAYSTPKSIKGTYEVKNDKVIVRCRDNDGTEYNFDFDVKSNGRNLVFNHSDPNEGGSMGNDYMSLELQ